MRSGAVQRSAGAQQQVQRSGAQQALRSRTALGALRGAQGRSPGAQGLCSAQQELNSRHPADGAAL